MAAKFVPTILHGDGWTYLRLAGVIDEDNRLPDLIPDLRGRLLVVDLRAVDRINSCGVRDWVSWVGLVERTRMDVVLADCSPAIVAQINLVGNFAGNASIHSFCAPYFCDHCDLERSRSLRVEQFVGAPERKAPTLRCEQCGGPMVFDDIEESYFAFLEEIRPALGRADVDRALAEARRSNARGSVTPPPMAALSMAPPPAAPAPQRPTAAVRTLTPPPVSLPPHPQAASGSLSRSDMTFYVAIGVLMALLGVVVYHIAVS